MKCKTDRHTGRQSEKRDGMKEGGDDSTDDRIIDNKTRKEKCGNGELVEKKQEVKVTTIRNYRRK